ncbi:putative membrane protein [Clostridium amylolyticum]|uniref:Putative membrane protein n=1 Tax=Clostridium amylolyticum TaxID=1121298 RepID=A0A1M6JNI2_9CLOT|nr:SHOCT domain-containing protein [Clostridium amylolyticum]SHJ48299.1 putative membrane protein [Clostridium amylolyticum]
MMRYGYNMMYWGGFFWFILIVLIIVLTIVTYKVISGGKTNHNRTFNDNAIEILKQRFAKGEIDEEQYKRMRDTIESK